MRGMKGCTNKDFSNGKTYAIIWIWAFSFISRTRDFKWGKDGPRKEDAKLSSQDSSFATTKNRGVDTTWGTYNSKRSIRWYWTYVKAITTWSDSNYIIFVVILAVTSYIIVVTTRSKWDHIISIVTITTTSDNKVIVTRTKNNLSTNNCIVINRGIRKTTTNIVYSKKSNNASI